MSQAPFQPIYPNPYIAGNPIRGKEMFFGRLDEFRFIERHLEGGRKTALIVLYGERRSGKSSILYQILNGELGEAFLPIFVDMQIMAGIASDAEFFGRIIIDTCKALAAQDLSAELYNTMPPSANATATFRKFLEDVKKLFPHRTPLLLIDEYEIIEVKIAEGRLSRHVLTFLAGLLETEQVSLVFTGSKELKAHDQALWQGELLRKATSRKISFLTQEDTARLITQPLQGKVQFRAEVVDEIYALTAGQPFYTQLICQNLVYHLNEVQKREVGSEDLQAVVDGIIENPPPQLLFNWSEHSPQRKLTLSVLAEFSNRPGVYLSAEDLRRALARSKVGIDLDTNFLNTELDGLFHDDHVLQKARRYSFRLDLYRRWLRHDHSIWQVMNEVGTEAIRRITDDASKRIRKRKKIVATIEHALLVVLALAVAFLGKLLFDFLFYKQLKVKANAGPFELLIDGQTVALEQEGDDSTAYLYTGKLNPGHHLFQGRLVHGNDTTRTQVIAIKGGLAALFEGRTQDIELQFPVYPVTINTDADSFEAKLGGLVKINTKNQIDAWRHTFHVARGRYPMQVIDLKTGEKIDSLLSVDENREFIDIDFERVVVCTLIAKEPFHCEYEWRGRLHRLSSFDGAPVVKRGLEKGAYRFAFSTPGNKKAQIKNHLLTANKRIDIKFDVIRKEGGTGPLEPPPPPSTHTLTIITVDPPRARVVREGREIGVTEFEIALEKGARYIFDLVCEGYDTLTIQGRLDRDTTRIERLKPQYGELLVLVKDQAGDPVPDADIFLDESGVAWSKSPMKAERIRAGVHKITVRKRGFREASVTCRIKKGKRETPEIILTR